jgi:hypothetical protein
MAARHARAPSGKCCLMAARVRVFVCLCARGCEENVLVVFFESCKISFAGSQLNIDVFRSQPSVLSYHFEISTAFACCSFKFVCTLI